jgi:hypothetical protein
MTDHLLARLVSLADCDGRSGEPLGKAMREAAAEISRLNKHISIMHDVADQRDTIILERDATIARLREQIAAKMATPGENISAKSWPDNLLQNPEN